MANSTVQVSGIEDAAIERVRTEARRVLSEGRESAAGVVRFGFVQFYLMLKERDREVSAAETPDREPSATS